MCWQFCKKRKVLFPFIIIFTLLIYASKAGVNKCEQVIRPNDHHEKSLQFNDHMIKLLGTFQSSKNRQSKWQDRFVNSSIGKFDVNGFHFTSQKYNMAYFIWDIFLRQNKIIFVTSRILPINLNDIIVTVHEMKEKFKVVSEVCANLLRTNYPDEVIIGVVSTKSLTRYLNYLRSKNSPVKLTVTVELFDYKEKYVLEAVQNPNKLESDGIVMQTKIGPDIKPQELLTFLDYYVSIGVDAFYVYFMIPIEKIPENVLTMWKRSPHAHRMTFVQWYPFYVTGPFPGSRRDNPTSCSEIGMINDALYRLKFSNMQLWLGSVDLYDYMVVLHARIKNGNSSG